MLSPSPNPLNLYSEARATAPEKLATISALAELETSDALAVPRVAAVSGWMIFAAGAFLVSVPVFFEAPLVRQWPGVSLMLSLLWGGLSAVLMRNPATKIWGDLLVGFTWSWLCGSIFWGWWRWEPVWHLPIEALALPIALVGLQFRWARVGNCFYLGSLVGTVITDFYFYVVDLMPAWKQLMRAEPSQFGPIFQAALAQMYLPWGMAWTVMLVVTLLFFGLWGLQRRSLPWMAFSGAVLSTILVDGLFWIAATLA